MDDMVAPVRDHDEFMSGHWWRIYLGASNNGSAGQK
jgi:hypothetical protein